jgi:hypothetical protein
MAAFDTRLTAAPLWLAAFAALIAVIGWETDWGRHVTRTPEMPAPQSSAVAVALLPDYKLDGGVEARRETVERPAFVPTRRPPPPPPVQEPPRPRLQRGQFVLTGTAVVDKQAIAFLREASTGKARTVRQGDTINGLKVTEIATDRITLAMGDETEGLALKVAPGPRTTIQPPQPAPAGGQPPGAPGQPPVAAAPGQAAPGAEPVDPTGQSLLERRRAARAAQAAAEAAARAGNAPPVPSTKPNEAPANAAPPAAAPPQANAPATGDNSWAEVYRRMQQPRR